MTSRCGYIALIGKPNVGKSTLLNRILGKKIGITSRKPQTTRHQLLGIKTEADAQFIYVDTPGLQHEYTGKMNRYMNKAAAASIADVDLVVWLIDVTRWNKDDDWILQRLTEVARPVLIAFNKIDKLKPTQELQSLREKLDGLTIIEEFEISAKHGTEVDHLENTLAKLLPENPHFFPADQVTDRPERFLVAEIIREKIMRNTGQELPYSVTVVIEAFTEQKRALRIDATIYVEREGQKPMLIGKGGQKLKQIGTEARIDIEQLLEQKVNLQLWVKVKSGWSDDAKALRNFGYE